MKLLLILVSAAAAVVAESPDVQAIMARVGENQTRAQELRKEYTFHQKQLLRLMRGNHRIAREERREYDVTPGSDSINKSLVHFEGKYERHGRYIEYDQPGYEYKEMDIDGELIDDLSKDMTDDRHSRDGLGCDLFPLTTQEQRKYDFKLEAVESYRGRQVYRVSFQPKPNREDGAAWKGEALIDAGEYQPVEVHTSLAFKIPLGVRVMLGTNIRGLGFSVTYRRLEEGVWFPASYGGEFELRALFFYARTISISMANENFRRTHVESTVKYAAIDQ
jgi:hypothetical protein